MHTSLNRWIQWSWISIWIASLLMFLVLAFFNHPSLDDYNYAVLTHENGVFNSQAFWFNEWSGRYFTNLVLSLSPLTFHSFIGYKILTTIVLLLFFATLFFFVYRLSEPVAGKLKKLYIPAVACLLYMLLLPTFSEGFYWMASALTYQLPLIFTMLFIIILKASVKKGIRKKRLTGIIISGAILIICISGANELSLISLLFIQTFLVLLFFWKRGKVQWIQTSWLVITVICAVIALSSPGNANRAELFNGHLTISEMTLQAGISLFRFIVRNIVPLVVFGLVIGIPWWNAVRKAGGDAARPWLYLHPVLSAVITLLLLFMLYWAGWYSTGAHLIARAENVIFFWMFLGWLWVIRNSIYFLNKPGISLPEMIQKLAFGLAMLGSIYFFIRENNIRSGAGDLLLKRASAYNQQMTERNNILFNCRQDSCSVPEIEVRPVLLYIGAIDAPEFPEQYHSWCRYFGKTQIKIIPKSDGTSISEKD